MSHRREQKRSKREERERARRAQQRRRQTRTLAAIGLVALLVAGLAYVVLNAQSGPGRSGTAPDFTLVDSDGNTFRLGQFRGTPVVLFFMTSSDWCQPCKVETRDHLRPLFDAFGSRIQILSLEMLPNDRSDTDLNAYKATYGSPWIYARDTAGVASAYGITALSVIVIVDQNGNVAFRQSDPSHDQMTQVLQGLGA